MQSVIEVHQALLRAGCGHGQDVRKHKKSDCGHQGDVYIHPIPKRPKAWNVEVTEHHQVALGSTSGSRHCADGAKVFWPSSKVEAVKMLPINLKFPDGIDPSVAIGPVIEADEAWTLKHPEHAHHEFPAGCYLVTYQVDWNTRREVRD